MPRSVAKKAQSGACLLWMFIGLVGPGPARAQTLPTLPPPPAPASSTTTLCAHLATQLLSGAVAPRARVEIAVTLGASARPEAAALLADAFEAELLNRHPELTRPEPPEEGKVDERFELSLAVKEGQITATARRRLLPQSIWEALGDRDGRVLATAFVSVAIDLELRALLGLGKREVRLDRSTVVNVSKRSSASLPQRILDCAVADADNDQRPELILLGPERVQALAWEDGGFSVELGGFELGGLTANESRLREPLGRLVPVVRADGTIVIVAASSDRSGPVVLTLQKGVLTRSALTFQRGWPLYATGVDSLLIAPWPAGLDVLEGGLTEARFGTAAASWVGGLARVHDVRGGHVAGRPVVFAPGVGGRLLVGTPTPLTSVPGVGVASLVTDLDADGFLELITTSLALAGPDRLSIAALDRPARSLWSAPVSAPVTALCAGDVDRDGFEEVVAATHDGRSTELYLVAPR